MVSHKIALVKMIEKGYLVGDNGSRKLNSQLLMNQT